MKSQFKVSVVIMITLCFISFNCSKKEPSDPIGKGSLKLNVGVSITVNDVGSKLKSGISTEDFHVQIFNSSNEVVKDFAHASEIPETFELPAGAYHAIASSENNQPAAFDNPFYQGNSGTFNITTGQASTVDITCTLANIMVTVVYSSKVASSFTDYSTKVSNTTNNLIFVKGESRAGFFSSGPLDIEASLLYTVGSETKTKTLTGNIASPQVGKHYEIDIDASLNEGGTIINISLDETVEKEIINITEDDPVPGEPTYGDILITEIMYDPLYSGEPAGEWIEIYNNSTKTINLKDLVFQRTSSYSHRIVTDINMAPGTYAVLGRSETATNNVTYMYSSIELTNSGCEIMLKTYGTNGLDGIKICSVNYADTDFPDPVGKSIQLDPTVKDATDAMLGSNWCASSVTFSTGDFGTPGLVNSSCD